MPLIKSSQSWTSAEIPQRLIPRLIGPNGSAIKAFQAAFPALSIQLNANDKVFHVAKHRRSYFPLSEEFTKSDSVDFDLCKQIIDSLLALKNSLFYNKLIHIFRATQETPLVWFHLPDGMSVAGGLLNALPPLYLLATDHHNSELALADSMNALDIGSPSFKRKVPGTQRIVLCEGQEANLQKIAHTFANVRSEFVDLYEQHKTPFPKTKLWASVGCHVYGHKTIRGELARALPREEGGQVRFSVTEAMDAMAGGSIGSDFLCAFPASYKSKIEGAMANEFGLATTVHTNLKKITVRFNLNSVARYAVNVPGAYQPYCVFKGKLVLDQSTGLYIVSGNGLAFDPSNAHKFTSVTLASENCTVPLSWRMAQDGPAPIPGPLPNEWDTARLILDEIVAYINENVGFYASIDVVEADQEERFIPTVPASILDKLSMFSIWSKCNTKARHGPITLTAKHVTVLVNAQPKHLDMCPLQMAIRPSETFFLIRHSQYNDRISSVDPEFRAQAIYEELVLLSNVLHKVHKTVQSWMAVSGPIEE